MNPALMAWRSAFGPRPRKGGWAEPPAARGRRAVQGTLRLAPRLFPSRPGLYHRIRESSNPLDDDLDRVSGRQGSYPGRGPRGDEIPRMESHDPGNEGDEKDGWEDQLPSARGLPRDAIHASCDGKIRGIDLGLDPGTQRRERVESLGARELHIPILQISSRHVIEAGVSQDGMSRVTFRHISRVATDNDRQFGLRVDPTDR